MSPESHREAFATFYTSEHEGQVRRAFLLLGSAAAAHDVVADAFTAVLHRWPSIADPGPYLNRCVLNGCRDAHRQAPREQLSGDIDLGRDEREPRPDPTDQTDQTDELAGLLLTLPFRQRAAIVLRFYGGHTEAEIAAELGCRPGTVGSLIHRGLRRLRAGLAEQGSMHHG